MATEIGRNETKGQGRDAQGGIATWVVGGGMVLIQACAVIPGLLPCLLLLLPFALPFVLLGAAAGLLVWVPVGLWRLIAWALRPRSRRRREQPPLPIQKGLLT